MKKKFDLNVYMLLFKSISMEKMNENFPSRTLHNQDVFSTSRLIWLVHWCEVMREEHLFKETDQCSRLVDRIVPQNGTALLLTGLDIIQSKIQLSQFQHHLIKHTDTAVHRDTGTSAAFEKDHYILSKSFTFLFTCIFYLFKCILMHAFKNIYMFNLLSCTLKEKKRTAKKHLFIWHILLNHFG